MVQELDVFWVLTVLALAALGAASAAGLFMSGLTGEPAGRIAVRAVPVVLFILVVLYLFQ